MKIFEMFFKHSLFSDMYDGILDFFSQRDGKSYQKIKEESDEDNNLFTQLLVIIYWSCLSIIDQKDYLKMKSWFFTASFISRHAISNYFSEIFKFLPEKYLETLTKAEKTALQLTAQEIGTDIKYLVLSQLFQTLKNIDESQRSVFIKSTFHDLLQEKGDPEAAAKEFSYENPLTNINQANQVYHAWPDFCDNLADLLSNENNKKRLFSYKQSYAGRPLETVSHDFINDFMNNIANQIKMETGNDVTGKLLDENTPVFIWMKKWLQLDDERKLIEAVSILKTPQSFGDAFLNKFAESKKKLKEVDQRLTQETTDDGLANSLNSWAERIRRKREEKNG